MSKDKKNEYNKSYYKKNKDAISKQKQTYRLSPEGAWVSFKSHKSNHSITKEQFIDWYIKTPEKCAYCESDFDEVKQFLSKNDIKIKRVSFDIDRKDNEKGYEISNIVKSCVVCNFHKADFYSYDGFKKVSIKYIKNKIKNLD
tara:strand:- start:82 stop:510 length:429 start_codon:yes stop_codon:yes gene_type:complete